MKKPYQIVYDMKPDGMKVHHEIIGIPPKAKWLRKKHPRAWMWVRLWTRTPRSDEARNVENRRIRVR